MAIRFCLMPKSEQESTRGVPFTYYLSHLRKELATSGLRVIELFKEEATKKSFGATLGTLDSGTCLFGGCGLLKYYCRRNQTRHRG